MSDANSPTDSQDEGVFDEYLDLALAGRIVTPRRFLASHRDVPDGVRERVEALHTELLRTAGPEAAREAEPGLPFERLGEFRLLRRLDEGGMGTVFAAEQVGLGRRVALKVVRADLRASEAAAARFDREVRTLAKLRHRNIVTVFASGVHEGIRYLAMEYVEGRDLDDLLATARAERKPLSSTEVVRWGERLARALQAAHDLGVIHRDVKPSNVRIDADGEPQLLDFGIARVEDAAGLTATGPFVGTPMYAAPEQIRGGGHDDVDARADVFGLGCTLYECLTGHTPRPSGTVDQVLHHATHEDPIPPRKLAPALSRDLETVLLKSLERDPGHRYQTAAAFADDLLAVLELQPIQARAPGPVRRAGQWARGHRRAATVLLSLAVAGAAVGTSLWLGHVAADRQRREDAGAALAEARTLLTSLDETQDAVYPLEKRIADTLRWRESHYLEPDAERELWRHQSELGRLRAGRERRINEILASLRRAERLGAEESDLSRARGRLHMLRWVDAERRSDEPAAEYFRNAALALDTDGSIRDALIGSETLRLTTEPPGAEVFLFRYVELDQIEDGGARRLVPVPVGDEALGVRPGTPCLRVSARAPGFEVEDLVLAVDGVLVTLVNARELRRIAEAGRTRARVYRRGRIEEVELPPGLELRPTAAPLLVHDACERGRVLAAGHALEPGSYLALVRHDTFESQRVVIRHKGDTGGVSGDLRVRLHPLGTTPTGTVLVEGTGVSAVHTDIPKIGVGAERSSFWIMEREVTCREYLEFLNAPAQRARIDAVTSPRLVPREASNAEQGGFWRRDPDGRFALPSEWALDWPVVGVSYEDALDFAVWRTARAASMGLDHVYELPTYREWVTAGEGIADRDYPFGHFFWPGWVSSCFSRSQATPEPVLGYPIDESPFGVYDLAGSATEWCVGWWGDGETSRRLAGGSWAQARTDLFKVTGGSGARPDHANQETGFRLVVRVGRRDVK